MNTNQRHRLSSNTNEDVLEDRDSRAKLAANTNESVAADED